MTLLLALVTSATAWAQTSASYRAYNTSSHAFETLTANSCTAVTSGTTTMSNGWYVVNSNVTVSTRITVNGTVNLILADGYSLTASQGITVNSGNTLNIYGQSGGTGTLNATGAKLSSNDGTEAAGIGSTGYSAVGNITIHGGRITATGADWSAGIGGGVRGGGGSVTIYGGTTSATAGDPNYGNQDAIGSGADGANVTRSLADGLRVTTYNNKTPVAYGNRVSNLNEKVVRVEPCTSHNLSNNVCTYCGLTIYTVTYNGNHATSGTVPAPSTEYQPGATVTILSNTGSLARTGYTYSGWNTAANGLGTDYTAGTTFAINNSLTLYAKWTPFTYTVRFHKNHDDATGTMDDQAFTFDVVQPLTANAFTREGNDFVGWSTTTDGAVAYTDGQSVSNLANVQGTVVNLYAQWAMPYTITYDLDGGTVATPNPTKYYEHSAAITLNNPTREGYSFAGWTGTGLTEPTITVTIPAGSTGNRSYTATWNYADSYIAYNDATGEFETRLATNCIEITESTTSLSNGFYVVRAGHIQNYNRITVSGTVHLILCDGADLWWAGTEGGVNVENGATIHIYGQRGGTGKLTAGSQNRDPGIGPGNVIVHGGFLDAHGSSGGAAIGGKFGSLTGGTLTVRGGKVKGSDSGDYPVICCNAIITGGTVEVTQYSQAFGGTITLGNMKVYSSADATMPVDASQRESTCRNTYVKLMPCTEHNMENSICTWCGFSHYGHVTYNGNNATSGTVPTDATEYETGQTVTVLGNTGNLARTGYNFAGWNTKADGSGTTYAPSATFIFNGATTLYAKWMPITYTVRFHKNHDDATGTMSDQAFTYDVAQKLTANAFTREGYQCLGWSTTTDGAVAYTNGQSVSNLATVQGTVVNLYAQWAMQWAMPYTITYDLAGGNVATPNPTNYTIESDAITLVNPTRDGYTFAGWTGTGLAGPTMTVTIPKGSSGNRSYTAHWLVNDSAYLAYNTTTGEFEPLAFPAGIVTSGTTTMGTANNESWYIVHEHVSISDRITVNGTVHLILADGTTLTASKGITVNSGNTLNIYGQTSGTGTLNATGVQVNGSGTESAAIGSTDRTNIGDITIHGGRITANGASWSAGIGGGIYSGGGSIAIYGGTVNATGHDGTSEAIGHGSSTDVAVSKSLANGLRVKVNNNPTPVDYGLRVSFLGQKIVTVEPCTEHNLSNNVCTYCGLSSYGVTYNSNNATSGTVPANAYYVSGQTVTVLGNTGDLTRTGYTFAGWNTQANGSGTTYTAGATFTINGNTTLYAKWTPITYTVRFNKNHNDATGTMSNQTFTYDVAQALATNAFTRDGWYFVGWSTETNSSSTYTDGQSIINLATEQDAVVNLYALWVQAIYTISYDLSGGTVATPNPTTYHELSGDITLVNPTKVGYYFVGWTGTGLTEPSKTVTIPAGSTGNRTYTATWIEMPLTEDTDEAEGTAAHWYVNMPATDTKTVTLSDATVTTFKVYDDGGKNGNYSFGCSGYLVLTAPAGYVLQLSGSIMSEKNYDKLTVYDGNDNSGTILLNAVCSTEDGTQTAITPVLSRGQSMTLYFYDSHNNFVNYTYAGLDLTVTLIDSNVEYNIDIVDAGNNNTLTASFGGNAVTTAKYNDVVTLTASPASGYLLKDFSVVDASGNDMSVTDMRWYTGASTATFTMPASAVTITSTFTNTWTAVGGLYINMPATGTVTATIPAGVQSFKVYDNGGAGGNYSNNCSGYLVLTAPTGYVLQLSGSITSQYYDYLTVYDGNDDSGTTLLNKVNSISTAAITTVTSTGQSMTLYFYSNGGQNYAGLDLTVTLLPVLELANNADNSDAISAADGNNRNVTLADRTIYTDGDWNTLCLPLALASFAGTPLEGSTVKTLTSSNFEDGTLTMTFSDNQTSIEAGKPYIVKYDADLFIRTAADWNNFATNVNNGTESYQGKVVKLAADISVSTMVGDESHPFKGTFDGCGHTLTFNYTTDADNAAPFQWIKNAVIKNLTVMGEIRSSKMFAAGFVARAYGDNAIENCVSSVTIHATKVGDGTHGGFVGRIESDCKTFTFTDCKFNGTFDGSNTDNWCPFAAWSMGNSNTNFIFNNCLCSPTGANVRSGNATFYRNGTATLNGAYYTQAIGTAQGTYTTATGKALRALLGSGWEIRNDQVVPKMINSVDNIVNPVFSNVLISDATANVETDYVDFIGNYSSVMLTGGDKSVLYLGTGNQLYYPTANRTMNACRAYFQLKGITAGDIQSGVKMYFGDEEDDADAILIIDNGQLTIDNEDGEWYSLDGKKLSGKPSQKGIYIHNGKKEAVK